MQFAGKSFVANNYSEICLTDTSVIGQQQTMALLTDNCYGIFTLRPDRGKINVCSLSHSSPTTALNAGEGMATHAQVGNTH